MLMSGFVDFFIDGWVMTSSIKGKVSGVMSSYRWFQFVVQTASTARDEESLEHEREPKTESETNTLQTFSPGFQTETEGEFGDTTGDEWQMCWYEGGRDER